MITQSPQKTNSRLSSFPRQEVRSRLTKHLQQIADDGALLRPDWEPLLDSKRVVGTIVTIEDLFPFKIPPDLVVRRGGYNDVNEALEDIVNRVEAIWTERQNSKVRR
jgi:hypothetical protein